MNVKNVLFISCRFGLHWGRVTSCWALHLFVGRPVDLPRQLPAAVTFTTGDRALTVMMCASAGGRLVTVLIITIITVGRWASLDKCMTNRQQPSPVVKDVLFFVGWKCYDQPHSSGFTWIYPENYHTITARMSNNQAAHTRLHLFLSIFVFKQKLFNPPPKKNSDAYT